MRSILAKIRTSGTSQTGVRCLSTRTSDLRQNKELVFVSFKKGFDKDITPATISLWIKQTVILCHELSDQEAPLYIRLKPMISGPLVLLRPSN